MFWSLETFLEKKGKKTFVVYKAIRHSVLVKPQQPNLLGGFTVGLWEFAGILVKKMTFKDFTVAILILEFAVSLFQ